jgi:hypothetical protein
VSGIRLVIRATKPNLTFAKRVVCPIPIYATIHARYLLIYSLICYGTIKSIEASIEAT